MQVDTPQGQSSAFAPPGPGRRRHSTSSRRAC